MRPNSWGELVAGAGAGCVSSILVCPLDVIRCCQQAQHGWNAIGLREQVVQIWRRGGGIAAFYRGLGPSLAGYVVAWASYFECYATLRNLGALGGGLFSNVVAATSAGAISTTLSSPFWVVRTIRMTDATREHPRKETSRETFIRLLRKDGVFALYRGLLPSYLGLLHVAVQFPVYEVLRKKVETGKPSLDVLASSVLAKIVACLATYPHEVLRTRLQALKAERYFGLAHAVRLIAREEGPSGFYRGIPTTLIRVVPSTAILFVTYEWLLRRIKKT